MLFYTSFSFDFAKIPNELRSPWIYFFWIFLHLFSDNAYDPDVQASQLVIDKINIQNRDALMFMDNGAGMDADKLYRMLS